MKLIDCIIRIKAFCFFKIVYSKVIPYKLGLLDPGFNSPGLTNNKKSNKNESFVDFFLEDAIFPENSRFLFTLHCVSKIKKWITVAWIAFFSYNKTNARKRNTTQVHSSQMIIVLVTWREMKYNKIMIWEI